MKNLVVIPAYNEEKTIREVVERALTYSDVLVVDDASKDKTPEILKVFRFVNIRRDCLRSVTKRTLIFPEESRTE